MYFIKLAVSMVLAGGVQRVDSSGTKIRGESVFTVSSMNLTLLKGNCLVQRGVVSQQRQH